MADFIEREALLAYIANHKCEFGSVSKCDKCETKAFCVYGVVESFPAADVAPVVHGRWEPIGHKLSRFCSHCGHDEPYKFADKEADIYSFCPNCGAKMDLEEDTNAR